MNTCKVKRHRNSDTQTEYHNKTTALDRSVMINWGDLTSFTSTTSPSVSEVVQKI